MFEGVFEWVEEQMEEGRQAIVYISVVGLILALFGVVKATFKIG